MCQHTNKERGYERLKPFGAAVDDMILCRFVAESSCWENSIPVFRRTVLEQQHHQKDVVNAVKL